MSTSGFAIQNGSSTDGIIKSSANCRTWGLPNDGSARAASRTDLVALSGETTMVCALRKLARALQFSHDCNRPKWDFAEGLIDLEQIGVSHDELRWLIGKGLVEHAQEDLTEGGTRRAFNSPGGFVFTALSCFVITEAGLRLSYDLGATALPHSNDLSFLGHGPSSLPGSTTDRFLRPVWDAERHELRVANRIVKRFKWRALNQEAILAAFQEDGWPPRIDDPLSPTPDTDPKRRLSDAIKCLNRKQQNALLRFSGDGTGEGVLWDLVINESTATDRSTCGG